MSTNQHYSFRDKIRESLFTSKPSDVPYWVVLRNTAAIMLPIVLGLLSDHAIIGLEIAVGALFTMFSDQPGPYRQRLTLLLLVSLAAGLTSLLGSMLSSHLPLLLLVLACYGFCCGMMVLFGSNWIRIGTLCCSVLLVTSGLPVNSLAQALGSAALLTSGGLLLTLFSVAAWPLQRYRPERKALVSVYRELAQLARLQSHRDDEVPALNDAMSGLQQTLLGRHHAHGRAMEAFTVLLELAERIRLELTALTSMHLPANARLWLRHDAAGVLEAIALSLELGGPPKPATQALQALKANESGLSDAASDTTHLTYFQALSGQLAAAVRNAHWAGSCGERRADAVEWQLPRTLRSQSILPTLRANLTPHAAAFRHAVRYAVCVTLALWIARASHLPHGYWMPMTVAIVLRADFAATFNLTLARVAGTLVGLVLTTVLLHITPHNPWAHLALMTVLCMIGRYFGSAQYGISVAALTGIVVILLSFAGVPASTSMTERIINTTLGSLMALTAYGLWPTWERGRIHHPMSLMLSAYAEYLRTLVRSQQPGPRREARIAARTARSNAEASLQRMRAEPATPLPLLEFAHALCANANRLVRTTMTLDAVIYNHGGAPENTGFTDFVELSTEILDTLAQALHDHRLPPYLPDLRSEQRRWVEGLGKVSDLPVMTQELITISDRLVDNVNTLAHVLVRSPLASQANPPMNINP